jgi:hypothetical protein
MVQTLQARARRGSRMELPDADHPGRMSLAWDGAAGPVVREAYYAGGLRPSHLNG